MLLKRLIQLLPLGLGGHQDLGAPNSAALGSRDTSLAPVLPREAVPDGAKYKNCVNTPSSRDCWKGEEFNLHTDYEKITPKGVLREYTLVIENRVLNGTEAPDGYAVERLLVNGTYPGPLIEGDWGDTFRITVHNKLKNHNGTSIHWHGVRQLNSTWQDGVAGVTQCPIPPGESMTYEWRATQYGTSWYHSHFSLQYPDGVAGPLRINGPTSMNYDYDLGPVLITDWMHANAFSLFQLELLGRPAYPDSTLMNGRGAYFCCQDLDSDCTGNIQYTSFNFTKGSTYKMSIVNTAMALQMTYWIDGHDFWVVSTDFVPIRPYKANAINVAIGQRYDIIVEANANATAQKNFWIHARDCTNGNARSELGIIRYDHHSTDVPWTPEPSHLCFGCLDEPNTPGAKLEPIVPRTVGNAVNKHYQDHFLEVALEGYPNVSDINSVLHKWVLADSSLYLDWSEPSLSLLSIADKEDIGRNPFPASYAPIFLDYDWGTWVYFLIEGKFTQKDLTIYKKQAPVAHPIHVHGHDFVILAQANETFDATKVKLNHNNPPRRDVAMLPVNGYLLIAFQIDNPGTWLMHCHIAMHASGGLALQFVERPSDIMPMMEKAGVMPKFHSTCSNWGAYYTVFNMRDNSTQEDSGI